MGHNTVFQTYLTVSYFAEQNRNYRTNEVEKSLRWYWEYEDEKLLFVPTNFGLKITDDDIKEIFRYFIFTYQNINYCIEFSKECYLEQVV